jgi:hypothetical protein
MIVWPLMAPKGKKKRKEKKKYINLRANLQPLGASNAGKKFKILFIQNKNLKTWVAT